MVYEEYYDSASINELFFYFLTSANDWWLKLKLGGVLLNTRTSFPGTCICCTLGVPETPSHFFRECEGLHPWSEVHNSSLPAARICRMVTITSNDVGALCG